MSQMVIAKRYARALVNLVEKESELDSIGNDLQDLAENFKAA